MIAIETKYLGWTETKPTRIKAYTSNGHSLTLSRDNLPDTDEDAHHAVAETLRIRMKWRGTLVGGTTKAGMVWVFLPREYETRS